MVGVCACVRVCICVCGAGAGAGVPCPLSSNIPSSPPHQTYMGQANPEDDSTGAKKSEMNFMRDQSSYNSGHSHQNREYTVMKKYTGRWFWKTWQGMPESTTTHELSSYKMPHYSGGLTTTGDGELNWRGNAKCGKNGAGINCYSQNSGSPNPSPNGGHGCRENLGKGWSGQVEW